MQNTIIAAVSTPDYSFAEYIDMKTMALITKASTNTKKAKSIRFCIILSTKS